MVKRKELEKLLREKYNISLENCENEISVFQHIEKEELKYNSDNDINELDEEKQEEPLTSREQVEARLKNSFFIVAGGAWQHLFEDENTKSMGFNSEVSTSIESKDLKKSMQPELLKRFREDIIFLPKMAKQEYATLIAQIASKLPKHIAGGFQKNAMANIDLAVTKDLGMRYFESVITTVLIESQNAKQQAELKL